MALRHHEGIGPVVLVTGGASGIGLATCQLLKSNGAHIIVADIDFEAAATASADLGRDHATPLVINVCDPESVDDAFSEIDKRFGRLDVLIHSAGIGIERTFLETSIAEWRRIIDIDLTGTFLCGQAAARLMMRNQYGRIVNIASTAGIRGGSGRAAYGAAKGGVIALTKVMAVELAAHGITVNALAPGAIETAMVARMHSPMTREVYRRGIPQDRYGTPLETAQAALFLASDEAAYITGHVLAVDGGFLAAGIMHRKG